MGNAVSHCEAEVVAATPPPSEEVKAPAAEAPAADNEAAAAAEEEAAADDSEDSEDSKATAAAADIKVETSPHDARFPATNQSRHCYTRYNEYYRCVAQKSEDDEECKFYARAYRSICPAEWLEKWREQRENGTYAGKY